MKFSMDMWPSFPPTDFGVMSARLSLTETQSSVSRPSLTKSKMSFPVTTQPPDRSCTPGSDQKKLLNELKQMNRNGNVNDEQEWKWEHGQG